MQCEKGKGNRTEETDPSCALLAYVIDPSKTFDDECFNNPIFILFFSIHILRKIRKSSWRRTLVSPFFKSITGKIFREVSEDEVCIVGWRHAASRLKKSKFLLFIEGLRSLRLSVSNLGVGLKVRHELPRKERGMERGD